MFQFEEDKLEISYQCETCGCTETKKAPECSQHGTLVCGVCKCDDGFKGNGYDLIDVVKLVF